MKSKRRFGTLIIKGIVFAIPISVFVMLIQEIAIRLSKIMNPVRNFLPHDSFGEFMVFVISILVCVLVLMMLGLLSESKTVRDAVGFIEAKLLSYVPGYLYIKHLTTSFAGIEKENTPQIVFLRSSEGIQVVILIEIVDEKFATVFVPTAPRGMTGAVKHVYRSNIIESGLSSQKGMELIRKLGVGFGEDLRKEITEKKIE